ncbi:MAG TPA: hypothetical protein VF223_21315 [Trebonia sp.]
MTAASRPSGPEERPRSALGITVTARRQRGWLALAAVVTVAGCAGATWWQVQRALHGNLLSDFYSALWPVYGCYVIFLWSRLRRGFTSPADGGPRPEPATQPDEGDEELRAYNRYLADKRADAQRRGR